MRRIDLSPSLPHQEKTTNVRELSQIDINCIYINFS